MFLLCIINILFFYSIPVAVSLVYAVPVQSEVPTMLTAPYIFITQDKRSSNFPLLLPPSAWEETKSGQILLLISASGLVLMQG